MPAATAGRTSCLRDARVDTPLPRAVRGGRGRELPASPDGARQAQALPARLAGGAAQRGVRPSVARAGLRLCRPRPMAPTRDGLARGTAPLRATADGPHPRRTRPATGSDAPRPAAHARSRRQHRRQHPVARVGPPSRTGHPLGLCPATAPRRRAARCAALRRLRPPPPPRTAAGDLRPQRPRPRRDPTRPDHRCPRRGQQTAPARRPPPLRATAGGLRPWGLAATRPDEPRPPLPLQGCADDSPRPMASALGSLAHDGEVRGSPPPAPASASADRGR